MAGAGGGAAAADQEPPPRPPDPRRQLIVQRLLGAACFNGNEAQVRAALRAGKPGEALLHYLVLGALGRSKASQNSSVN